MDPQVPDPEQPKVIEGQTPKVERDNHWITILSMATFVLLALGAVAFLYYQNQQLKSMLASYQAQVTPAPSATPDVTANWKTYTNTKYDFSFKYPSSWAIKEASAIGADDQVWLAANSYSLPTGTYGGVGNGGRAPISFIISHNDLTTLNFDETNFDNLTVAPYLIGNLTGVKKSGISKEGLSRETVVAGRMGNWYINIIPLEVSEKESLDQILSTFKFTQ